MSFLSNLFTNSTTPETPTIGHTEANQGDSPIYTMTTSTNGLKKISVWEGNILHAYQDSIGVWTIGVGHTAAAGLPNPVKGMTITTDESLEILARDIKAVESQVKKYVKVTLNQNQFDATVSWVFNCGPGNFTSSTFLRDLNNHDFSHASVSMQWFNKAGGKVIAGLTTRRKEESELFLS